MTENRPETMPLFPLPNAVLFPHTTLRLHVFEPRYVEMVEDLLRGEKWLAVALLNPEQGPAGSPPAVHPVAGAGRIGRSSRLSDGHLHIEVTGRERVLVEEVPSDHAYRLVRAAPHPEDTAWLARREAGVALREMLVLARGLAVEGGSGSVLPGDPDQRLALVNEMAARAFSDHRERQQVLEATAARERVDLVRNQLRLWIRLMEAVERSERPDDPSVN